MADELDQFEQTTHGSLFSHGARFLHTSRQLEETYRNPTRFTVSELSQVIRGFLKEAAAPEIIEAARRLCVGQDADTPAIVEAPRA